jgi:two-component system, OmpR family, sensor kinase
MSLPIRARVTLLFAALITFVLLIAGAFVHFRFRQDLLSTVDAGLSVRAESLIAGIGDSDIPLGEHKDLIDPDEAFAQVVGPNGELIESSSGFEQLLLPRSTLAGLNRPTYVNTEVIVGGEPVEARVLAVPSDSNFAVVGASLEEQNQAASRLIGALLLGESTALVVITLIGWLVTGAALSPVERMRAEAAEISADEPGRRLEVPSTRDELARLGETMNEMLDRLEHALEHERRFVGDASHELRTPLGILKTELDLALGRARSPEELTSALRSAAEESDRLNSLAEDLLVLARADRGQLPVHREEVDVLDLAGKVLGDFHPAAEAREVRITVVGDAPYAKVDPARLRQALCNLIANALHHSRPGGEVQVKVNSSEGRLHVTVSDEGVGFPNDFLERAFEPFTRVDSGRGRTAGGAGLGLAIVKAIAESHDGIVTAENGSDGGAIVSIDVPG